MASVAFVRALSSNTFTQNHHNGTSASLKQCFQQHSHLRRSLLRGVSSSIQDVVLFSEHMVSSSPLVFSFPLWETRNCKDLQLRSTATKDASIAEEDSVVNNSSKCVLVVGATGGVGQLVVAALLDRGIKVCAVLRNREKATTLFGEKNMDKIEVIMRDTRDMKKLNASDFEGVTHVICCTGTTAFPSKRWDGDNTPENTDWHGVRNLIDILPRTVKRVVLVSSVGVTKYNELPWSIMNLFGVLKYKKMGEDYLRDSGIPYTIIRPGRLTDGPYTSYDLNTLLKATAGTRRAVIIGQGDKLVGEASRIVVAEACVQALDIDCTCGNTYEINSIEGDGPGKDKERWEDLFKKAHSGVSV